MRRTGIGRPGTLRRVLAWLIALAPGAASAQSIDVLWYAYAAPHSVYTETIQKIADTAHTLPRSSGLRWNLTFFGPQSPTPKFSRYNVLVIQSGEPLNTVQSLLRIDKKREWIPDYSGILGNKSAIESARGERTFITGSDADQHAIFGDTGNAPQDPHGRGERVTCHPPITGKSCWDGALGHLVNAVNWAGSGRGLGIVSLLAAEHPASRWWLDSNSFLRAELQGFVTIWGAGTRENHPVIPAAAQKSPLNAGLTSKGLGGWRYSFHAGFSHAIPGYVSIVDSTMHPNTAVAIATAKFAGVGHKQTR